MRWLIVIALLLASCVCQHDYEKLDSVIGPPSWPYQWKEYCEKHPEVEHWRCDRWRQG